MPGVSDPPNAGPSSVLMLPLNSLTDFGRIIAGAVWLIVAVLAVLVLSTSFQDAVPPRPRFLGRLSLADPDCPPLGLHGAGLITLGLALPVVVRFVAAREPSPQPSALLSYLPVLLLVALGLLWIFIMGDEENRGYNARVISLFSIALSSALLCADAWFDIDLTGLSNGLLWRVLEYEP